MSCLALPPPALGHLKKKTFLKVALGHLILPGSSLCQLYPICRGVGKKIDMRFPPLRGVSKRGEVDMCSMPLPFNGKVFQPPPIAPEVPLEWTVHPEHTGRGEDTPPETSLNIHDTHRPLRGPCHGGAMGAAGHVTRSLLAFSPTPRSSFVRLFSEARPSPQYTMSGRVIDLAFH